MGKNSSHFFARWNGLHEAAFLWGLLRYSPRYCAFSRPPPCSSFGATQTLDIYYAAFRIPDFVFAGIASFMSALVLILYKQTSRRE